MSCVRSISILIYSQSFIKVRYTPNHPETTNNGNNTLCTIKFPAAISFAFSIYFWMNFLNKCTMYPEITSQTIIVQRICDETNQSLSVNRNLSRPQFIKLTRYHVLAVQVINYSPLPVVHSVTRTIIVRECPIHSRHPLHEKRLVLPVNRLNDISDVSAMIYSI